MEFPSLVVYLSYCGCLGLVARRDWAFVERRRFQYAAVVVQIALSCWCARALLGSITGWDAVLFVPAFAFVVTVGVFLEFPFLSLVVGESIEKARRWFLGIDRMVVERTPDLALKAEREGRPDEALRLYEAEPVKHPPLLRRIADLHLRRGDPAAARPLLEQALDLARDPHERAAITFRLADISDAIRARRLLERLAGTPFEPAARRRLSRL